MAVKNFDLTSTGTIIPASSGKCIRILAFYYLLDKDWVDGNLFSFRWEDDTEDMFPRDTKGVVGMVLATQAEKYQIKVQGPVGKALKGYISAGSAHARGTVIYEYV